MSHDHQTPAFGWQSLTAKPCTIGMDGPVGSGETALVDRLCMALRDTYHLAVRMGALPGKLPQV